VASGLDRGHQAHTLRRLVTGCAIASAVLLPLVLLFLSDMAAAHASVASDEAAHTFTRTLQASQSQSLDGLFWPSGRGPAFLVTTGVLALLALTRRPWTHEGTLLALFLVFVLLSFGPALRWRGEPLLVGETGFTLPFAWLVRVFPFLDWLYWPERFLGIAAVALAGLAALGTHRLVAGVGTWAVLLPLLGLGVESLRPLHHAFPRIPITRLPELPGVYRCLDYAPPGAVLVAPIPSFGIPALLGRSAVAAGVTPTLNLNEAAHRFRWWQTLHGRPLYAGVDVPHTVPAAWRVAAAQEPTVRMLALAGAGFPPDGPPPPEALSLLRTAGIAAVILHDGHFARPEQVRPVVEWISAALGAPACRSRAPSAVGWIVR
jgi:hypothetical protein